ncbi:hypothetical protein OIV83_003297 [Microbotryomycetes sp. JL201]|nr:hypothetical protein OIV83_003297 [Microbotryomycetes sp. JL201]
MAVTPNASSSILGPTVPLTDAQAAQIPSSSLPIGPQLSHLLHQFTTLALQLFSALSTSSPHASENPIMQALADIDSKLARLLAMLDQHQKLQGQIQQLVSDIHAQDDAWHSGVKTLHSAVNELTPIVESGAQDRQAIEQTRAARDNKESPLGPKNVLSYARLLAPFTSAPPSSLLPHEQKLVGQGAASMDPSGNRLPLGAIPPFPTEAVMRRGRLQFGSSFNGFGQALGETEEVGARKEAGPLKESVADQSAVAKLEQQARRQEQQQHQYEQEDFSFDLDLNPDL